jgi:hypothetical protein
MNMTRPLSYLSEFLEEYPLYSKFGTDQPAVAEDLDGLHFNFHCKKEKATRGFMLKATGSSSSRKQTLLDSQPAFTEMYTGICQSCEDYKVDIIINGGTQEEHPKYFLRKIGQYPPPQSIGPRIPAEIARFLDRNEAELYSKAVQCIEFELGVAAFSYFSKLLPGSIEKMAHKISNDNEIAGALRTYKKNGERIAAIEAITILVPDRLKEHGANALLVLCDACIEKQEILSEEEYLKKSKNIDLLFRYLAKKIDANTSSSLNTSK